MYLLEHVHAGLCYQCPVEQRHQCLDIMFLVLFGLAKWEVVVPDEYRQHNVWMELVN